MNGVEISQCIILLSGAFALLTLGILFIKLLGTTDRLNITIDRANRTIDKANRTLDDINYKLNVINRPFEIFSNFISPIGGFLKKRK